MARSRKWGWAILSCALTFAARPSEALPPNACVPLFDPDYDRASQAYAAVEISDARSACFMIPRDVIHKELREFNSQSSVMLDPVDLLSHLNGKMAIKVANEERRIDESLINCLSTPVPSVIMITDGPPFPLRTPATLKLKLLEIDLPLEFADSDLPGYHRYVSVGPKFREDYYFPDKGPDPNLAFWCGSYFEPETCIVQGDYDGMEAKIGYRKEAMRAVSPERALECVRAIGDLFRIDNDKS